MVKRLLPLLLVILLGACTMMVLVSRPKSADPIEYAERSYDLDKRVQDDQATETSRQLATDLWNLLPPLLLVGIIVTGLASFYQRQRRERELLRPDDNGLYPIDASQLSREVAEQVALMLTGGAMQAAVERARASYAVPAHLTYSPRISAREGKAEAAPTVLEAEREAPLQVPSFASLIEQQRLGRGNPLILGYTEQGPLFGAWRDLYSSAIAGVSGSGKTTTIRFLAAQSALHGSRFVILDPHADAGDESLAATLEPLQRSFLCEPAGDERAMLNGLALVRGVLDRRLQGDGDRTPLIVAIDEFTRLMSRSAIATPLGELLEAIAGEGRKVGIFCLLSGQIWTAERSGGTALRDSLASCYVHRLKRSQGRMLLPTEEAREAEHLQPGRAILARTSGECLEVAIPQTTAADVRGVARLLGQASEDDVLDVGGTPAGRQQEAVSKQTSSLSQSPEEARVVALFREGADIARIAREVYGLAGSGGRRYQECSAQIQQILRQAL